MDQNKKDRIDEFLNRSFQSPEMISLQEAVRELKQRADIFEEIAKVKGDSFNLIPFLEDQREFSLKTFGPGSRTKMNIAHIKKELVEIEEDPFDIEEWVDVILLAFDGAMRHDATPRYLVGAICHKFEKNQQRDWPDWRTADKDAPIEHIRGKND